MELSQRGKASRFHKYILEGTRRHNGTQPFSAQFFFSDSNSDFMTDYPLSYVITILKIAIIMDH